MVTWKIFKLPDNIAIQNGRTVTLGSPSSSSVFTLLRRLSYSSNPAIWNSTKIDANFVEEHLIVTNCTGLALRINCGLMAEKRCFKEGWQLRQLDCESRNEFFKTPCLSAKNLLHFQNEEFDLPFAFSLEFGRVFHQPTGQGCCCMFYQELCLLIIPKGRLKSMTQKWTCFSITQIHGPSHN